MKTTNNVISLQPRFSDIVNKNIWTLERGHTKTVDDTFCQNKRMIESAHKITAQSLASQLRLFQS